MTAVIEMIAPGNGTTARFPLGFYRNNVFTPLVNNTFSAITRRSWRGLKPLSASPRTNLVATQDTSGQFNTATPTANAKQAPDGTTTGVSLANASGTNPYWAKPFTPLVSGDHTVTLYLQAGTSTTSTMVVFDNAIGTQQTCSAAVKEEGIGTVTKSGNTAQMTGLSTVWTRVKMTITGLTAGVTYKILVYAHTAGASADTNNIYVWGWQAQAAGENTDMILTSGAVKTVTDYTMIPGYIVLGEVPASTEYIYGTRDINLARPLYGTARGQLILKDWSGNLAYRITLPQVSKEGFELEFKPEGKEMNLGSGARFRKEYANAGFRPKVTYNWSHSLRNLAFIARRTRNLLLWSEDYTNGVWQKRGTLTVTPGAIGPDGLASASLIAGLDGIAVGDMFQYVTIAVPGGEYEPSFYIKRVSTSGEIQIYNPADGAKGEWRLDLSKLGSDYERITRDHKAVTIIVEFTGATASSRCGIHFVKRTGTGTLSFYLAMTQLDEDARNSGDYVKTTTTPQYTWGGNNPIETMQAVAAATQWGTQYPITVQPHLDNAWTFDGQVEPTSKGKLEITDTKGVAHKKLDLSIVGKNIMYTTPDWA